MEDGYAFLIPKENHLSQEEADEVSHDGIVMYSAPEEMESSEEIEEDDSPAEKEEECFLTPEEHLLITPQSQNNNTQSSVQVVEKLGDDQEGPSHKGDASEGLSRSAMKVDEKGSSAAAPQEYVTLDDLIDDGDDDNDLLVAAVKGGIKFPRPRWWGAEGYGRRRFKRTTWDVLTSQ